MSSTAISAAPWREPSATTPDSTKRLATSGVAAATRVDFDGLGDANGYRAAVGTRFDVTQNFEGEFKVNHYNGRDFAADNSVTLSGQYKFGRTWGVTSGVEFNGGVNTYNLGVRASF